MKQEETAALKGESSAAAGLMVLRTWRPRPSWTLRGRSPQNLGSNWLWGKKGLQPRSPASLTMEDMGPGRAAVSLPRRWPSAHPSQPRNEPRRDKWASLQPRLSTWRTLLHTGTGWVRRRWALDLPCQVESQKSKSKNCKFFGGQKDTQSPYIILLCVSRQINRDSATAWQLPALWI